VVEFGRDVRCGTSPAADEQRRLDPDGGSGATDDSSAPNADSGRAAADPASRRVRRLRRSTIRSVVVVTACTGKAEPRRRSGQTSPRGESSGASIIADFDQSVDLVLTAVWTNGVVMSGSARPARMSFVGLRDSFVASDALSTTMPSGVVTFLFTDIEGSTHRWESDPDAMRVALADHDSVLQSVIEAHEGRTFKHTGDGVCAAFSSACHAVDAAIEAQLRLALPVRMGLATGEVEAQGSDYFDVTLNRTARVMSAGHGGQILVAASTAELLDEVDLIDLGSRRLRDLSEALQIFQVRSEGLRVEFPPLKTVDTVPGNLPVQATSFIGREAEVAELGALVQAHRLVTLIGVGGVGKTRLAVQVAAEMTSKFADGVWFVELAPVGDPVALPNVVATALGVAAQAGITVTDSLALALSGRRLLIVLDNCEHVLDAAAELVEAILTRTATVSVIATSREALRVGGENSWSVPSLDVRAGVASAAVSLFVERARAVRQDFTLDDVDEVHAVTEICRRLDGIALAIELAAARMVAMSPQEVRDRLDDRFRLLSGSGRGLERHRTLRQAVQWSFDLLTDEERGVLGCCSVFADGFELAAISAVYESDDEYVMLDLMDSLVRKSLVTVERAHGRTRYGTLETIRQFAEDQLVTTGTIIEVRDRHAHFFADETTSHWQIWDGPRQRESLDWVADELANLRTSFRWATDQGDLRIATVIAAHAAIMSWPLQRFEPVGWAEEILEAVVEADLPQLPRLYIAASLCLYGGRPDVGVTYAQAAARLELDARYDSFVDGWSGMLEALAHLFGGRINRRVEICTDLAERQGFARVVGLCGLTWALPAVGRADEATVIADETVAVARDYGSPFWIGWALGGYGRAFAEAEPVRALEALREGLDYAHQHRLPFWEANLAQDAARLEAVHGELDDALALFSKGINSFHHAGNVAFLAATFASLAVFFDRFERPEIAAIIYGASTRQASISLVPHLPDVVSHLRSVLGITTFDKCVAAGTAQEIAEAVRYAHEQIQLASRELSPSPLATSSQGRSS
jgi:predicted ATPase/class 3 adenylate cyclase